MAAILELPSRDQIAAFCAAERMQLVQELARAEREVLAAFVDVIDVMDAEGDHVADGHRNVKSMVVALTNSDHQSTAAKVKAMKTLRHLPEVRGRLRAGEFGVPQVMSLTTAYGNPRARDHLEAIESQIIDWADWRRFGFQGGVMVSRSVQLGRPA